MKIAVVKPCGGAFHYIAQGFINAFNAIGEEAYFWNGKPETFNNPDLYIGCSGHRQEIPKNWTGKIAIHVNPYGDRLEPLHGIDINESRDAIRWTLDQKPDIVFGYGLQEDGATFWKNWANFVGCPTAGDATIYYPEKADVDYEIAFLGGRWPYKGNNIDKWFVPVAKKLGKKVAIHGWGGWQGFDNYKGPLPESDCGRVFLSSANVCPCVCEPHTTVYGIDIPERFFKAALCGSLPVLDKIEGFDRYCSEFVMASNPSNYIDLVTNYACNPDYIDEGRQLAKMIRKEVLAKHTYFNRMMGLCTGLNFENIVKKFEEKIKTLA